MKLWGIDLGGTKIECAVLENDRTLVRRRLPTEAAKGYAHIIAQVARLIDAVAAEVGERPAKIGFATPGVLDAGTGLMKNCNTVAMNGRPMKDDLERALRAEAKLANDANCFALAETRLGAGREFPGAEVVFGVIMGTGVGGGLVVRGQLVEGRHGIAGEWGHNVLEENGAPCYCGKRGCVETVISGAALERHYRALGGEPLSLEEIVAAAARGGDAAAAATVERLLEFYGRAIATLINVLDPQLIVIGGGVGNVAALYDEGRRRIERYFFDPGALETPIRRPALGDSAGVFGAALL